MFTIIKQKSSKRKFVSTVFTSLSQYMKKLLSLDEKELENLQIDTTTIKIRIDDIKREIRIRRGDIDGLIININIDLEDLLKKMKKNIDGESN